MDERLGEVDVYVARPAGPVRGGLVLIHELWGLVPHIRDVADRYAAEGFLVAAPDILTRAGIPPEVGQELQALTFSPEPEARATAQPRIRDVFASTRAGEYSRWALGQLRGVLDWLDAQPGVDGRVAVTGFCFGGVYTFALAATDDRVRAAVPFYGALPDDIDPGAIRCPVLAFYGSLDTSLMASLPTVRATFARAGVAFEAVTYEGRRHAFFNDTNPATYEPEAAQDAWTQSLAFLDTQLNATDAAPPGPDDARP